MSREYFFTRYQDFGEKPRELKLCQSIRLQRQADHGEVLLRLAQAGAKMEKIPFLKNGYWVLSSTMSVGATIEYLLGQYYVQEAASQLPVEALFTEPPHQEEIILDTCSAPGGKTTQIALYHKGPIVALEKLGSRIDAVKNHVERMGITNVAVYKKDARFAHELGVQFDRILVDAPCSGNFVTDVQWFGKRSIEMFLENQRRQKELLKSAYKALKPGGTLVYSTCSLEPEENEIVVDWALKHLEGLKLAPIHTIGDPGFTKILGQELDPSIALTRRLWPWKTNTQGFFIARFKKQ